MSEIFPAKPIFFHKTPEGQVQDYHTASRRPLIFLSSGILGLETSEGLRTIFRPGDRLFADDATGAQSTPAEYTKGEHRNGIT